MICPRCQQDRVDPRTGDCRNCGHRISTAETVAIPGANELERQIDQLLGKDFKLEGLLGRGGMSVVFLAQERRLNRLVALKILPFTMVLGSPALDRFEREAKISASLDHPHIVPIYNAGSTGSFMWISMKYIKGRSLAELLDTSGPMELDVALDVLGQIASALNHAHQQGVVHRDIKPENVMIDAHGWAWLSDFGIAKALDNMPLTQTGGTMGTPGYMSPEQCYSQPTDGRTDQYSFAILAFRALGGRLPFEADSMGEMITKHCLEPPPSLDDLRDGLPPRVSLAIIKAMAKKREERFETVTQFVEAMGGRISTQVARQSLRKMIDAATGPVGPVSPTRQGAATEADDEPTVVWDTETAPVRPWWRRPGVLAGAGGAVALVAALALWNPFQPSEPASETRDLLATRQADSTPLQTQTQAQAPVSVPQAAARPPVRPPQRTGPAVLWVRSDPIADLYVNDAYMGTTNIPYGGQRPGSARLRIRKDGYQSVERTVTLRAGDTTKVTNITLPRILP